MSQDENLSEIFYQKSNIYSSFREEMSLDRKEEFLVNWYFSEVESGFLSERDYLLQFFLKDHSLSLIHLLKKKMFVKSFLNDSRVFKVIQEDDSDVYDLFFNNSIYRTKKNILNFLKIK